MSGHQWDESGERCLNCGDKDWFAGPVCEGKSMHDEKDPTGRGAHESGAKLDHGKNRLGLVVGGFSRAVQAVGEVGTYGADKYTENGWMAVPDGINRYTDAMYRHLMKEAAGEARDQDTQLLHAAHAAWNAMARLDLMLREAGGASETQLNDNRWLQAGSPEYSDEYVKNLREVAEGMAHSIEVLTQRVRTMPGNHIEDVADSRLLAEKAVQHYHNNETAFSND